MKDFQKIISKNYEQIFLIVFGMLKLVLLIQQIFLAEGMLLSFIGAIGGMCIALILYYLQTQYKLVPLQGDTFLIDYYPVKLSLSDFLLVGITVLAIGILASWIPSKKAAAQAMELRN